MIIAEQHKGGDLFCQQDTALYIEARKEKLFQTWSRTGNQTRQFSQRRSFSSPRVEFQKDGHVHDDEEDSDTPTAAALRKSAYKPASPANTLEGCSSFPLSLPLFLPPSLLPSLSLCSFWSFPTSHFSLPSFLEAEYLVQ